MGKCNPFGYATDAGPRHLMGGLYGPEYAGKLTINRDGVHGVAVCENTASGRFVLVCPVGHRGPVMDLCQFHAGMIMARMAATCTACVWPPAAIALNDAIDGVSAQISRTWDMVTAARLRARAEDLGREMDELIARGVIARRPLTLVEVS
jgi:hypothetical protein